jgi:hypothetical protein
VALLRFTFDVIHPLLLRGQWLSVALGQLRFEDSWQRYPYKTDSRHVYALTLCYLGNHVLPKQRASGRQCGKDMLYFGKDILKVTMIVTCGIKLPFGKVMPYFAQASANSTIARA